MEPPLQCWIEIAKADILALIPIMEWKHLFFYHYFVSLKFFIDSFYQVENLPLYSQLVDCFAVFLLIRNGHWCWDDYAILAFIVLVWFITLIDFHILSWSCILGMNSTWWWSIIFFACVGIFVLLIFYWQFLHLYSWGIFVMSLSGFRY